MALVRAISGPALPVTRLPSAAELDLIRGELDPSGLRESGSRLTCRPSGQTRPPAGPATGW
jgi:hypothetical protein